MNFSRNNGILWHAISLERRNIPIELLSVHNPNTQNRIKTFRVQAWTQNAHNASHKNRLFQLFWLHIHSLILLAVDWIANWNEKNWLIFLWWLQWFSIHKHFWASLIESSVNLLFITGKFCVIFVSPFDIWFKRKNNAHNHILMRNYSIGNGQSIQNSISNLFVDNNNNVNTDITANKYCVFDVVQQIN